MSLAMKEMQIKMTLRFHLTPSEWLSSRKQITNTGKDVGRKEPLHTVGGNVNSCSHYGDQHGGSRK
jgi:hypothetical protein